MSRSKVLLSGSIIALSMSIAGFANAQGNCVMNGGAPVQCNGAYKVAESIELNAPVQYSAPIVETKEMQMPQMHSMGGTCNMAPVPAMEPAPVAPCGAEWYEMGANGAHPIHTAPLNGTDFVGANNQAGMINQSTTSSVTQYSGSGYYYNSGEVAQYQPQTNTVINQSGIVTSGYDVGPSYSYGNENAVQYVYGTQMPNPIYTGQQQYSGVGPVPAAVPQVPVNYYGGVAKIPGNVPQYAPGSPNAYGNSPYNGMPQYGAPQYSSPIGNAPVGGTYNYPISSNPIYSMNPGRGMPVPNGSISQSFFFGPMAYGVGFPTQTGYLGGGSAYYGGGSRFSGVVGRSPTPLIPPAGGKPHAPPPPPPVD